MSTSRWPDAGSLLVNSGATSPARRYSGRGFDRGKRCRVRIARRSSEEERGDTFLSPSDDEVGG
jgi:hypothetical protein